jgi:Cof subfamily protein (haloacid dehalogenase superfamily)
MSRPRLIALDLDGTLLDEERQISERSRRALARAVDAGTTVILCTGRPPRMTHDYAEALSLEQSIVFNGATLLDHRDRSCVHHHVLTADAVRTVVSRLRGSLQGVAIGLETPSGWFVDEAIFREKRARQEAAGLPPPDGVGRVEEFLQDGAIKVFARHADVPVERMAAQIADLPIYVTWSGSYLLEVMHPDVNKRDALERLCAELGILREDVAAFGDNHNDVQMLRWAGQGVAVANASPEAQEAAAEVTASNAADGVAVVLERWFG